MKEYAFNPDDDRRDDRRRVAQDGDWPTWTRKASSSSRTGPRTSSSGAARTSSLPRSRTCCASTRRSRTWPCWATPTPASSRSSWPIVQLKPGETMTDEEVIGFVKEKGLAKYKWPEKMVFAAVPRNPAGKIEKPKLREIYVKPAKEAMDKEFGGGRRRAAAGRAIKPSEGRARSSAWEDAPYWGVTRLSEPCGRLPLGTAEATSGFTRVGSTIWRVDDCDKRRSSTPRSPHPPSAQGCISAEEHIGADVTGRTATGPPPNRAFFKTPRAAGARDVEADNFFFFFFFKKKKKINDILLRAVPCVRRSMMYGVSRAENTGGRLGRRRTYRSPYPPNWPEESVERWSACNGLCRSGPWSSTPASFIASEGGFACAGACLPSCGDERRPLGADHRKRYQVLMDLAGRSTDHPERLLRPRPTTKNPVLVRGLRGRDALGGHFRREQRLPLHRCPGETLVRNLEAHCWVQPVS